MIKEEIGDTVLHALLISPHDTDFYCIKPDGTKYLIKQRKSGKTLIKLE